jgi:hypothetical protein
MDRTSRALLSLAIVALPLLALPLLIGTNRARAAEIERYCVAHDQGELCGLRLTGEIDTGDFVRLRMKLGDTRKKLCERDAKDEESAPNDVAEKYIRNLKRIRIQDYCKTQIMPNETAVDGESVSRNGPEMLRKMN